MKNNFNFLFNTGSHKDFLNTPSLNRDYFYFSNFGCGSYEMFANSVGSGFGDGYAYGEGNGSSDKKMGTVYPFQLIQYWE